MHLGIADTNIFLFFLALMILSVAATDGVTNMRNWVKRRKKA